jgi:hypothetical protein
MPSFIIEREVDFDPEEFWSECSDREREEISLISIREGYTSGEKAFITTSYREEEIAKLILDIWQNKDFMTVQMVDSLREELRNKRVL